MSNTIFLPTQAHTEALGACVAQACPDGALIFLRGHLGAGKTTFSRGVVHALGYTGAVKSPTYTLCDEYETEDILFLHVDLYRLSDSSEIQILDLDRPSEKIKVIIIEWPEIIGDSRSFDLKVSLSYRDQGREALLENKLINK